MQLEVQRMALPSSPLPNKHVQIFLVPEAYRCQNQQASISYFWELKPRKEAEEENYKLSRNHWKPDFFN